MLTAVIIDDEKDSIAVLSQLLKDFTSTPVKVVGTANNLDEGIKAINSTKQILFFWILTCPKEVEWIFINPLRIHPLK